MYGHVCTYLCTYNTVQRIVDFCTFSLSFFETARAVPLPPFPLLSVPIISNDSSAYLLIYSGLSARG